MKTYDYKDETKDVRGKVIITSFEPSLKIIMARAKIIIFSPYLSNY